ncbi:MAG: right-handed parallel beta-helix repeat-containing protein [Anaerolineae bacterium]
MTLIRPVTGLRLTQDTQLQPGVYLLPGGLSIDVDNVTLDGQGARLIGGAGKGYGVTITGRKHVAIKNLHLQGYIHGIHAADCENLTITDCHCTGSAELPPNSRFLDIWKTAEEAYGGGIFLHRVIKSRIHRNDLQHQMNGLLTYQCRALDVHDNIANYCSGFGFHLNETCDSRFTDNYADFCCRYHPRSEGVGHMGADAAGFLIVNGSCRNIFRRNFARLGGDGFFLAGLTPQGEHVGCDDNLFEQNDGSYSPNIAFEGTFSRSNIYRGNRAMHCNYGFWLGFSADCVLEENQIWHNRQAGIAVENGYSMTARGNDFRRNGHGILLWSKYVAGFARPVPQNDTSRNWLIEDNTFWRNSTAVRIAANQDHGIRPLPDGVPATPPPHHHTIRRNQLQENRVGIELQGVRDSRIEANEMRDNVVNNRVNRA